VDGKRQTEDQIMSKTLAVLLSGAAPAISTIVAAVQPGTPARVETAEGKGLVFSCEPGAQKMSVELPPDFKVRRGAE
jgi:hypothetical protein